MRPNADENAGVAARSLRKRWLEFGRLLAGIFAVSLFVHYMWEMLQSFAYDMSGVPIDLVVVYHLWATMGDGALMMLLYAVPALLRRNPVWLRRPVAAELIVFAVLAVALSAGIEWHALASGRWSYTAAMPLIPLLNVGLLPVLQLLLLPLPIFWLADRIVHPGAARRHSS